MQRVHVTHDAAAVSELLAAAESTALVSQGEVLWLRFEPMIVHVCCQTWQIAQSLLVSARRAGIKRTAVFAPGPKALNRGMLATKKFWLGMSWRVVFEGDDRLEMPLLTPHQAAFPMDDKQMVAWLGGVLEAKFARNMQRIERMESILRSAGIDPACE